MYTSVIPTGNGKFEKVILKGKRWKGGGQKETLSPES